MKCLGCGKGTLRHGVPFTLCERCERIVERFLKAKESHKQMFKDQLGIKTMKFKGRGDAAFYLNEAAYKVAEIEEQIEWLKRCILNLANQVGIKAD